MALVLLAISSVFDLEQEKSNSCTYSDDTKPTQKLISS